MVILFAVVFHCNAHIRLNVQEQNIDANNPFHIDNLGKEVVTNQPTCSSNVQDCVVCQRCIIVFAIGSIFGFFAILLTRLYTKKQYSKRERRKKN